MLRAEGYPVHARVCERHTGAGSLFNRDYQPELGPCRIRISCPKQSQNRLSVMRISSIPKPRLERQKTIAQAEKSLAKFGNDGLERFKLWEKKFCLPENMLHSK
jgi:uncharacterized protein